MSELVEEFVRAPAAAPAQGRVRGFRRRLARALLAEAPADYDAAMARVGRAPGWLRLALVVGASVAGWAGIVFGVAFWLS